MIIVSVARGKPQKTNNARRNLMPRFSFLPPETYLDRVGVRGRILFREVDTKTRKVFSRTRKKSKASNRFEID